MRLSLNKKLKNILGAELYTNIMHTKNYFSANILTQGFNFILIPIKTRILTPADYGILAIVSSIIQVFNIFFDIGTYGSVNRYYHEKKDDFYVFIRNAIIYIFIVDIFFIFLIFLFKAQIQEFVKIPSDLIMFAAFISFANVMYLIYMSYLNAKEKSKLYSNIAIIKFLFVSIPAIIWMYLLKENRYLGQIYSMLIIGSLFGIYIFYKIVFAIKTKYKFTLSHIVYIMKFGIPLIPHALSGIILAYFDRIIINQLSGNYKAGIYSFAYNVSLIIYMIIMAITKTWNPFFYRNMREKKYLIIKQTAINNSKIVFFLSFVLALFLKEIIMILAPPTYYESLRIIPIIILSYNWVFLYTICASFSFYKKKTYLISLFTLIASIINIFLNYWLIPTMGYQIAAYTTLLSYIVLFLLHYFNVKFILKYNVLNFVNIFKYFFIYIALYMIIQYVLYNVNFIFGITMKVIIVFIILYFTIKKKINKLSNN